LAQRPLDHPVLTLTSPVWFPGLELTACWFLGSPLLPPDHISGKFHSPTLLAGLTRLLWPHFQPSLPASISSSCSTQRWAHLGLISINCLSVGPLATICPSIPTSLSLSLSLYLCLSLCAFGCMCVCVCVCLYVKHH
jgi:hypothetical protein